ncbi:hypothetical protein BGZ76_005143 [Entomortierella beljakovae]|nr:hypothetical protein BGZ76_005143 [Entomortierella beljakovae]
MSSVHCEDCSKSFDTRDKLKSHRSEFHSRICSVLIEDSDGNSSQKVLERHDSGSFLCPGCSNFFQTRTDIRRHVIDCLFQSSEPANEESAITHSFRAPKFFPLPIAPDTPSVPKKRTFNDLAIAACGQNPEESREIDKTLALVNYLELYPVHLKSKLRGNTVVTLTHSSNIPAIIPDSSYTASIEYEIQLKEEDKQQCARVVIDALENLMGSSPYSSLLRNRQYFELDDSFSKLMNESWGLRPELKYACARLLSGSILLDTKNNHAILANSVEVYGRKKSIDSHRETFRTRKGKAPQTSLPPTSKTRYLNVWPLTLSTKDGERLVIGTHPFNALITSSNRLDVKEKPSVGGETTSFTLHNPKHSSATRIFLDQNSIKDALSIANDKNAWRTDENSLLEQLRQVRSKFDCLSTYYLCRSSGDLTRGHAMQPYTVFTLADSDSMEKGQGYAAALIFQNIGLNVVSKGKKAKLKASVIEDSLALCEEKKKKSEIFNSIERIQALFQGEKSISIIRNKPLNRELTKLAKYLSSYITTANHNSIAFIESVFE